jgi:hypothetical protein
VTLTRASCPKGVVRRGFSGYVVPSDPPPPSPLTPQGVSSRRAGDTEEAYSRSGRHIPVAVAQLPARFPWIARCDLNDVPTCKYCVACQVRPE